MESFITESELPLQAPERLPPPPDFGVASFPQSGIAAARRGSPFLASLCLHLLGLTAMASWSLLPRSTPGQAYLIAAPATEAVLETQEFVATLSTAPAANPARITGLASQAAPGASAPSVALRMSVDRSPAMASSSVLQEVNGLFRGAGDGMADLGQAKGGAEFFGVRAAGRRFVFVVDSSRSMRGQKWSAACRELLASVARLNGQQAFYVIFFDVDTHPMFSQRKPEPDLLPATEETRKRLRRWLPSIKLGSETRPHQAMQLAMLLKPDAVFLLSDGEFVDGTRSFLLSKNFVVDEDGVRRAKIPVHAIGFHSPAAGAVLAPIAEENGGDYRFIGDH